MDSQPEQGTTFTVYYPAAIADPSDRQKATRTEHPAEAASNALRILYVDDDLALTYLVQRQLQRRGYHVSVYRDQQEALAALHTSPGSFDLLVTDFNMPGIFGLAVARLAREISRNLPIAITSGFMDDALHRQAREIGVQEVLLKAASATEFCDAIQRVMQAVKQPLAPRAN